LLQIGQALLPTILYCPGITAYSGGVLLKDHRE
jgi:hypothetical protein